jgi:hypothetical protein
VPPPASRRFPYESDRPEYIIIYLSTKKRYYTNLNEESSGGPDKIRDPWLVLVRNANTVRIFREAFNDLIESFSQYHHLSIFICVPPLVFISFGSSFVGFFKDGLYRTRGYFIRIDLQYLVLVKLCHSDFICDFPLLPGWELSAKSTQHRMVFLSYVLVLRVYAICSETSLRSMRCK